MRVVLSKMETTTQRERSKDMSECKEYPLVCKECESPEVYYENPITGCGKYACQDCGYVGERKDFNVILTRDELDSFAKAEQERDSLQAQVVLLRECIEMIKDKHINPLVNHKKYPSTTAMCLNALATTPSEAAERVSGLVEALEKLARLGGPGGGYGNSDGNIIAQRALAAWRKHE